jgi:hypothetical protein
MSFNAVKITLKRGMYPSSSPHLQRHRHISSTISFVNLTAVELLSSDCDMDEYDVILRNQSLLLWKLDGGDDPDLCVSAIDVRERGIT